MWIFQSFCSIHSFCCSCQIMSAWQNIIRHTSRWISIQWVWQFRHSSGSGIFFWIKWETPVFWLLYCLFGIRKLQYVYSINVNLSQKQDNILVCSSLCKCCSGGAVWNFCGVLSTLFESELEADEAK